MVEKKVSSSSEKHKDKKKMEKVYFSEDIKTCFACGEKIDAKNTKCPYCGTNLKKE